MKISEKTIANIIKKNNYDKCNLLAILMDIQVEYNWLPPQALKLVADGLNISLIEIYGVASFYHAFSLSPRGKHVVTCCQGTACHVRGAPFVLKRVQDTLKIEPGETTKDNKFTLETVNCLGACALAPIIVIDGNYYGQATVQKIDGLLMQYSRKKPATKAAPGVKRTPRTKKRAKRTTKKKARKTVRKIKTRKKTASTMKKKPAGKKKRIFRTKDKKKTARQSRKK